MLYSFKEIFNLNFKTIVGLFKENKVGVYSVLLIASYLLYQKISKIGLNDTLIDIKFIMNFSIFIFIIILWGPVYTRLIDNFNDFYHYKFEFKYRKVIEEKFYDKNIILYYLIISLYFLLVMPIALILMFAVPMICIIFIPWLISSFIYEYLVLELLLDVLPTGTYFDSL